MSCPNYKRLCDKLIISNSVTFSSGNLLINIPQGNYLNNEKYCIVVAQAIPDTTTISAPVYITIGGGTATYQLLRCNCTPANACSINKRTRYSVIVKTTPTGGNFVLTGKVPCSQCSNNLVSLPAPTTVTTTVT